MGAGLTVQLNGQSRSFAELKPGDGLAAVVEALGLKADRIAVELNGEIAPRSTWTERTVNEGDRLEIVHFVGGGAEVAQRARKETRTSEARLLAREGVEQGLPAVAVVGPAAERADAGQRGGAHLPL